MSETTTPPTPTEAESDSQESVGSNREAPGRPKRDTPILTDEDRRLLRTVHLSRATDEEFEMFVRFCERMRLDPLKNEVYTTFRYDKQDGREVLDYEVSLNGLRVLAERTGTYRGERGPYWCGDDQTWREVWLSENPPAAAKVGVLRDGFEEPIWGVARWEDFKQTDREGNLIFMWENMDAHMLGVAAERIALRRAFPTVTGPVAGEGAELEAASAAGRGNTSPTEDTPDEDAPAASESSAEQPHAAEQQDAKRQEPERQRAERQQDERQQDERQDADQNEAERHEEEQHEAERQKAEDRTRDERSTEEIVTEKIEQIRQRLETAEVHKRPRLVVMARDYVGDWPEPYRDRALSMIRTFEEKNESTEGVPAGA